MFSTSGLPKDNSQVPSIHGSTDSRQIPNGPMRLSLVLGFDHASSPMPDHRQECIRRRANRNVYLQTWYRGEVKADQGRSVQHLPVRYSLIKDTDRSDETC
jgi:hypothetical protein